MSRAKILRVKQSTSMGEIYDSDFAYRHIKYGMFDQDGVFDVIKCKYGDLYRKGFTRDEMAKIIREQRKIIREQWWITLKPCPFCNSNEAWTWPYDSDPTLDGCPTDVKHVVRCKVCGMGQDGFNTDEEARIAWNRRKGE